MYAVIDWLSFEIPKNIDLLTDQHVQSNVPYLLRSYIFAWLKVLIKRFFDICTYICIQIFRDNVDNFSCRAASMEDHLHDSITPSKSKKAMVFGSLEKMFHMLTPKKQTRHSSDGPRKVKVSIDKALTLIPHKPVISQIQYYGCCKNSVTGSYDLFTLL